jgi:hypothetical protein
VVSVRLRSGKDLGAMPVGDFIAYALLIIAGTSLDLQAVQ